MPKVEDDAPRGVSGPRDVRAAEDRARHDRVLTKPERIPPVHVLEAAHHQERKETEDLLSAFDRPRRSFTPPSAQRDFVDYYARRPGTHDSGAGRDASARRPRTPAPLEEELTIIKPRPNRSTPAWLWWSLATALMIALGAVVAYVATSELPSANRGVPSAAATTQTLTGATTPVRGRDDFIPPPDPPSQDVDTPGPFVRASSVPAPVAIPSDTTSHPRTRHETKGNTSTENVDENAQATRDALRGFLDGKKAPLRDDFIRDL